MVYWFERRVFLVLTGMPRSVLGESCTPSIKDFAIFPPHQKKKKKKVYRTKRRVAFYGKSTILSKIRLVLPICIFFSITVRFITDEKNFENISPGLLK